MHISGQLIQSQTKDSLPVSKPELGVKRICANCGGKFYDLHNDPIVCLSEMRERVHPGSTRPDVAALGGAPMARGRREGGNAGA